jgi:hypothetical protein
METVEYTHREVFEIWHALFYEKNLRHGTTSHNQLMLIARMAKDAGFSLDVYNNLGLPDNVVVTDKGV